MRKHYLPYVILALVGTLTLAGLFYLPYLSVRNKTINAFRSQQTLVLEQVAEDIKDYFSTYHRAITYLAEQDSIQAMNSSGQLLLDNFFAIHSSDILAIVRSDTQGAITYSASNLPDDFFQNTDELQRILLNQKLTVSRSVYIHDAISVTVLTCPVMVKEQYLGNISFYIAYQSIVRRYIDNHRIDASVLLFLFGSDGTTLYGPKKEYIGRLLKDFQIAGMRHLQGQLAAHQKGYFTLINELDISDRSDSAIGKQRHGVYLPVDLPGNTFWSLVIVAPENEVLNTMSSFRRQWVMVTLLTMLSVACLGIVLTFMLAKRREEEKQRQFEEQLIAMLDYAPMGVLLVNDGGMIRYANSVVVELFGLENVALQKTLLTEFLAEEHRPTITQELMSKGGATGAVHVVCLVTTDGAHRDVKLSVTSITKGKRNNSIVLIQDITEERQVEEIQRRLFTAVEQVQEIILITDINGSIEYVNSAFNKNTGYASDEIIGQSCESLCSSENDKHLLDNIREVVMRGEIWQGRIVNQRKDETLFISATTVSPVRNHFGAVTHWVVVQRDVTNEVEIESRLRQAQKMEAIGTFAGGIAHDFNNILGAIIGFTDMALLQSQKGSEMYEHLTHIRQGGKRAADLVDQILTFSRQSTMNKIAVSVAPVIKESLRLIRASIPSTIEIERRIIDQDIKVMAAPVQLQQIMMNLCSNAFFSMRDKGGILYITLEKLTDKGCCDIALEHHNGCLCLTVRDSGVGMDAATLERIFNPFFTTKEPGEGTGMGLSVVQGIVHELGGDIQVESTVGKGTTFSVFLPLVDTDTPQPLLNSELPLPSGHEHVVVVDDEKEIQETFSMMLAHFGYSVTATGNPKEVLSILEEEKSQVDLVITDLTMPVMTGLELTRKLAELRPELPVILCTGYSDRLNEEVALATGACRLMMKPVDLQELAATVRAAIEEKRAGSRVEDKTGQ